MAFGSNDAPGRAISDINVTPLVDVMLVLLVIFMVTAPIMQSGIAVDLPVSAGDQLAQEMEDLVVSIDASGAFYVDEVPLDDAGLRQHLESLAAESVDRRVYVRADSNVEYGRVMAALDVVRRAGLERVGLVTQTPSDD